MDNFDDNAVTIANYLEDKMTPEEAGAFIAQLGKDAVLRDQFEEALQVKVLLKGGLAQPEAGTGDFFQPADDHLAMVKELLTNDNDKKAAETASLRQMFAPYRRIAAVLLLASMGIVLYILFRPHKSPGEDSGITKNVKTKPAVNPPDSSGNKHVEEPIRQDSEVAQRKPENAKALLARYNTLYEGRNDPVEVSLFYEKYRARKYEDVLHASEADYKLMGTNERKDLLSQYMGLYKGLSLFSQNKTAEALEEFQQVLSSPAGVNRAYYAAQWYTLLAALRKNDLAGVRRQARSIMPASPYKQQVSALVSELPKE